MCSKAQFLYLGHRTEVIVSKVQGSIIHKTGVGKNINNSRKIRSIGDIKFKGTIYL